MDDKNRNLHNVLLSQQRKRMNKYRGSHGRTRTARFRCETLGHILALAIADRDAIVRKTAIAALKPPFDRDLAQVDMLRPLFVALNDEDFEIINFFGWRNLMIWGIPGGPGIPIKPSK